MTSTPSATASPKPLPPGCSSPIDNGGFEADRGWTFGGALPGRYTGEPVFRGARSLLVGVEPPMENAAVFSSAWQPVRVPYGASTMKVSARLWQAADPVGSRGQDRQYLLVYDVDPAINNVTRREPTFRVVSEIKDDPRWLLRTRTFEVDHLRGATLWLYAGVRNDGEGSRAWMYVDDARVLFCP